MRKGIQLSLLVGPVVPIPAPRAVLDELESVQVTTTAGQASGFQLVFRLSKRSPLHTLFLVAGGGAPPLIRVIVVATVNGTAEVLIDGVMTNHQISAGGAGRDATLTVTGEDLTRVMDLIDFSGVPYPAMPPEARVALIIAKYAVFGLIPLVIPSVLLDVPIPVERIPRHQGTDLQYIRRLADDVGYIFYLEPGPTPGVSQARWGPEIKVGAPQPALTVDSDIHTNVESLGFEFDNTRKTLPVLFIQNQQTKVPIPIPIPDITPLNPPLGAIRPIPNRIEPLVETAKLSPIQAALLGLAKAARTSDAVKGSGALDVLRYGRVLKARQLVGVRGAGTAFDGLYYVSSVTHSISRGEYKQSFQLTRNGLVSTVPSVPV